ncbi:beta family protein [Massilia endophytica]|uniref:beta family protein n=1 Tax=Massilia endophytica TaxID=2899220 RepID=UPI001E4C2A41|nr:beta family protein [Massilia endophytica]UGQ46158.1 beta family protein [Massilia endophytica]
MDLLYVPILPAKQGEFAALSNLQPSYKSRIRPVFDVPNPGPGKPREMPMSRTAAKAGKAWGGKEAFLDITKWKSNARTESGIHVLEYSFAQFRAEGVQVHPVVGYDRWDDPEYSQALKNIAASHTVTPCIRLDRESLEDTYDLSYFSERMGAILVELEVEPKDCVVLVDLGDVSKASVPDVLGDAETAIDAVRSIGFETVVIAGSSMPATINLAVDEPDAVGCIPRIEMMAWKAIFEDRNDLKIVFGDYAVRNPDALDGVPAPHANAKIRYTISNQTFVVRGHSKKITRLAIQNTELACILVSSHHYMGPTFSWGDSQILQCSVGAVEMGSPTTWIAIDSNHHIQAVLTEVFEFQRRHIPGMPTSASSV